MSYLRTKFAIRLFLATIIRKLRYFKYRIQGYDIHPTAIMERNLNIDRLYPQGVHIGANTLIASNVTILAHDHCKRVNDLPILLDTRIGDRCFIAVGALILPGITIGDEVIVGAGAVVTKNVPSNVIVAGNPAKIIRQNIRMNDRAELVNWTMAQGWTNT